VADAERAEVEQLDDAEQRFEAVTAMLAELDIEALWAEATDQERRVLLDELLQDVTVLPDHLQVTVHGAPALNVTLEEVGLGKPGEDWSCRRGDLNSHDARVGQSGSVQEQQVTSASAARA
jgi:hypothetical protein